MISRLAIRLTSPKTQQLVRVLIVEMTGATAARSALLLLPTNAKMDRPGLDVAPMDFSGHFAVMGQHVRSAVMQVYVLPRDSFAWY